MASPPAWRGRGFRAPHAGRVCPHGAAAGPQGASAPLPPGQASTGPSDLWVSLGRGRRRQKRAPGPIWARGTETAASFSHTRTSQPPGEQFWELTKGAGFWARAGRPHAADRGGEAGGRLGRKGPERGAGQAGCGGCSQPLSQSVSARGSQGRHARHEPDMVPRAAGPQKPAHQT